MSETPPEIRQLHLLAANWLAAKGPHAHAEFIVEAPRLIEGVTADQARAAFDHEASRLFGAAMGATTAAPVSVHRDDGVPPQLPDTAVALIDAAQRRKPAPRWTDTEVDRTILGGLEEFEDMVRAMAENAWYEDPRNGQRRLKMPELFTRAAGMRRDGVQLRLDGARELYTIDRLQAFVKGVAKIVFKHAADMPLEVRAAITADVRDLYGQFFPGDSDGSPES